MRPAGVLRITHSRKTAQIGGNYGYTEVNNFLKLPKSSHGTFIPTENKSAIGATNEASRSTGAVTVFY